MNIGIEGSQTKEQVFSLTVNKKDQGYLLKNFGAEGWGLRSRSIVAGRFYKPTKPQAGRYLLGQDGHRRGRA